ERSVPMRRIHSRSRRRLAEALVGMAAVAGMLLVFPSPSSAAAFDVTNNHDSGPGSLRQALADAATAAGDDDVNVQAGLGTITLGSPLVWNGNGAVTINGHGITINANGAPRGLVDDGGDGLTVH